MNAFYNRKRQLVVLEAETKGSACFNLYAARPAELIAGEVTEVALDINSVLQPSCCCMLLGTKVHRDAGILVPTCVIDADWSGDWVIPLLSMRKDYMIKSGEKVGQFMIHPFGFDNLENEIKVLRRSDEKMAQDSSGDTNIFIPLPTMLNKPGVR